MAAADYCQQINPVIVAGVHQEIAAIHPFADGNGRTLGPSHFGIVSRV